MWYYNQTVRVIVLTKLKLKQGWAMTANLKSHSGNDEAIVTDALSRTLFVYWHRKIKGDRVYLNTRLTMFIASLGGKLKGIFVTYVKAVLTNPQRT